MEGPFLGGILPPSKRVSLIRNKSRKKHGAGKNTLLDLWMSGMLSVRNDMGCLRRADRIILSLFLFVMCNPLTLM